MSGKTVWVVGGLVVAIGAVAYLSYHETPAGKDAAGTIVAAKRAYVDGTSGSGSGSQTGSSSNGSDTSGSGNASDRGGAGGGDSNKLEANKLEANKLEANKLEANKLEANSSNPR